MASLCVHVYTRVSGCECLCVFASGGMLCPRQLNTKQVSVWASACALTGVPDEGLPTLLLLIMMY